MYRDLIGGTESPRIVIKYPYAHALVYAVAHLSKYIISQVNNSCITLFHAEIGVSRVFRYYGIKCLFYLFFHFYIRNISVLFFQKDLKALPKETNMLYLP